MPAYSSLPYNEVLLLGKLRKNSRTGFKRVFECYYPRLYFFVCRLLKQDASSNRITLDCFVKLADIRPSLTSLQDAFSFLYSCAHAACMEFRSQNDFFSDRRTLMGYNLPEKKSNASLDILFAETSFAIYLALCKDMPMPASLPGINVVPLHGATVASLPGIGAASLNRLPAIDGNIAPATMPSAKMNCASDLSITDIMRISVLFKDHILCAVYHKKNFELSPARLQELNDWLMPDIERRVLLDEMKDPVNRDNAIRFFKNINNREGFEMIKHQIPFVNPFSFTGVASFIGVARLFH